MGAPGKEYVNDNVMLARSAWAGTQRYGTAALTALSLYSILNNLWSINPRSLDVPAHRMLVSRVDGE